MVIIQCKYISVLILPPGQLGPLVEYTFRLEGCRYPLKGFLLD